MYEILEKKQLNKYVDRMKILAPLIARNCQPGHFIILRVDEDGERIPLTVVEHDDQTIDIIYQKLGFTTSLLGEKQVGDTICDLVGPLGESAHIHDVKNILAIAGGVGAAPLYPQLKAYKDNGVNIDLILGAKSIEYLLLIEEFQYICDNIYFCTDDGSLGLKGFVTDMSKDLLTRKSYDHSIAIGPLIMMKNVVMINKKFNLKTDVSLNPIMIDGTGMCGNCRVTISGKTYFACVDGPDFPGEDVDYDELLARQDYYKEEEHVCNLEMKLK